MKDRIEGHQLFICDCHFTSDRICLYPDRKKLIDGALPSLNLPQKSSDSFNSPANRSSSSITKREQQLHVISTSLTCVYKDFTDFKKRVAKLSLGKICKVEVAENLVYASFQSTNHILPKFEVFVDERLYFFVRVYGWMLPDNHEIYSM